MRQAWLARRDLAVLVMSATLDAAPVARFLGDCPVIAVPGAEHPLTVEYAPGEDAATAIRSVVPRTTGDILCFLPGAREIEHARQAWPGRRGGWRHRRNPARRLDGPAQEPRSAPAPRRRVILATNIAKTSLTVPGVSTVVDTGLVKSRATTPAAASTRW